MSASTASLYLQPRTNNGGGNGRGHSQRCHGEMPIALPLHNIHEGDGALFLGGLHQCGSLLHNSNPHGWLLLQELAPFTSSFCWCKQLSGCMSSPKYTSHETVTVIQHAIAART